MAAEDWEFRREARRCTYSAERAETPGARRMMQGYARFYESLAESSPGPGSRAESHNPARREMRRRRAS